MCKIWRVFFLFLYFLNCIWEDMGNWDKCVWWLLNVLTCTQCSVSEGWRMSFSETSISKLRFNLISLICNECMLRFSMIMMEILEYSSKWSTIVVHVNKVIPRFTCYVFVVACNCIDHLSLLLHGWYNVCVPTIKHRV